MNNIIKSTPTPVSVEGKPCPGHVSGSAPGCAGDCCVGKLQVDLCLYVHRVWGQVCVGTAWVIARACGGHVCLCECTPCMCHMCVHHIHVMCVMYVNVHCVPHMCTMCVHAPCMCTSVCTRCAMCVHALRVSVHRVCTACGHIPCVCMYVCTHTVCLHVCMCRAEGPPSQALPWPLKLKYEVLGLLRAPGSSGRICA